MPSVRANTIAPDSGRRATATDLPAIAQIHKLAYSRSHFTSLLPLQTLMQYYARFLDGETEIYLDLNPVDRRSEGEHSSLYIQGFAVYGTGIPERIAAFKKAHSGAILLTSLRHPILALRKGLAALLAKASASPNDTPTEFLLLSIAVTAPRKGIGNRLLDATFASARLNAHDKMGLYVNCENIAAINAYSGKGFHIVNHISNQYYMEKKL